MHGTHVVTLTCEGNSVPDADAAYTQVPEVVCAIMTADCLPVLFCNQEGTEVAAAHAGWRGLLDGVIENTVAKFSKPSGVMAWLGPAIGPSVFEVGSEVREQFMSFSECAEQAFKPYGTKWLADIHLLARQRLSAIGVESVYGDSACTFSEPDRFFSYRRDQQTGRQASFIWLED
ncbi:hypothetical protein A8L45_20015 [Veronia pacifica]|uniref:Purine nucleoside phosphorylase n=1 Tax=Veronia pacifica TaxID=1080227 RepID=A0A1C3EBA0_9GAMM|nr:hypothetical protein A8L45_20015 [Veronia pacifica]